MKVSAIMEPGLMVTSTCSGLMPSPASDAMDSWICLVKLIWRSVFFIRLAYSMFVKRRVMETELLSSEISVVVSVIVEVSMLEVCVDILVLTAIDVLDVARVVPLVVVVVVETTGVDAIVVAVVAGM